MFFSSVGANQQLPYKHYGCDTLTSETEDFLSIQCCYLKKQS